MSGRIQTQLGYKNFPFRVVLSAMPALILSRFIPTRGGAERAEPGSGAAS